MKRFLLALCALAIGLPADAQFDPRTTGSRTQTYNIFRAAPSLPSVSNADEAIIVYDPACDCLKASENGGAWFAIKPGGGSGSGAVSTIFGRDGAVAAQLGDYTASLVSSSPFSDITGTTVQDQLEEINAKIGAQTISTVFGRAGAVTAVAGDYTATQITSTATGDVASITVQAAIAELASEKLSASTNSTITGLKVFSGYTATPLVIQPASAPTADLKLFDLRTSAAVSKFSVDAEGDVIAQQGSFLGATSFAGAAAFTGAATFSGATALGSSATATTQDPDTNSTALATTAFVRNIAVADVRRFVANPTQLAAFGDGTTTPLSTYYATLTAAQADYSSATALTDELDWAVLQTAFASGALEYRIPAGTFLINRTLTAGWSRRIVGAAVRLTTLKWNGATSGLIMYAPGGTGTIDGLTIDGDNISGVNGIRGDASVAEANPYGARWGSYEIKNTPGVALEMNALTTSGLYYTFLGHPYIINVGTGIKFRTTDGTTTSHNNNHVFGAVRIGTCTTGVDLNLADGISFQSLTVEGCTTGVLTGANSAHTAAFDGWFEGNTTDVSVGNSSSPFFFFGSADTANVFDIPFSGDRSALTPWSTTTSIYWLRGRWMVDQLDASRASGTPSNLRKFQLAQVGLTSGTATSGATVNVTNISRLALAYTASTEITNFTTTDAAGHVAGHLLFVIATNTNAYILDGTNIDLTNGTWAPSAAGDSILLEYDPTYSKWIEISRSSPKTGPLDKSGVAVATGANTTETDLWSDTLPTHAVDGFARSLRYVFWGTFGANTNAKTLRFKFPNTATVATCSFSAPSATSNAWRMTVDVYRGGSFSQDVSYQCVANGATPIVGFGTATATSASAIAWKLTGQNGVAAASDIVFEGGYVELLP